MLSATRAYKKHKTNTVGRKKLMVCGLFTGDCSSEDYSQGVASFDQFSQVAFNNGDKARVTTPYYRRSI